MIPITYSTVQKECKRISVLFDEIWWNFKWNDISDEVSWIFETTIVLNENENSRCYSQDHANIRAKYR